MAGEQRRISLVGQLPDNGHHCIEVGLVKRGLYLNFIVRVIDLAGHEHGGAEGAHSRRTHEEAGRNLAFGQGLADAGGIVAAPVVEGALAVTQFVKVPARLAWRIRYKVFMARS